MTALSASISVNDVTMRYNNGHTAIYDVTFALQGGTICALVGVNGSGKSTLFKSIMGLIKPQQGNIALCGLPINRALKQNLVAYVKTENAIVELLRQLRAEGHLILVSTHNLGSVPDFCDQVVMINRTVIAAGKTEETFNQHNLEKVFGGVLRHIKLLGEDLHNDEDKRAVTVLTDDERPVVFYGETKNDPPATAVKSCRLPPSDKE